ncbi:hypothetical protein CSC17_0161 [Klebsiella oxytoca]|nr:hypothetical protein CSC17_0161 [Klebsiella oxytoca]
MKSWSKLSGMMVNSFNLRAGQTQKTAYNANQTIFTLFYSANAFSPMRLKI